VRSRSPATRRADIQGHFFNTNLVKEIPASTTAMSIAVELLEDQALARTAMGEVDLADAARERAARLRALARVIEEIEK